MARRKKKGNTDAGRNETRNGNPGDETGGNENPGDETGSKAGGNESPGDKAGNESPGEGKAGTEQDDSAQDESGGTGPENEIGGGRIRLGVGTVSLVDEINGNPEVGDAPPAPKPEITMEEPKKKRGRPPGSKNKSASGSAPNSPSSPASNGPRRFGPAVNEIEAGYAAKAIVSLVNMPLRMAATFKEDARFMLSKEETEEMETAFRNYMMIRGDILGEWGPEIILGTAVTIPLYKKYMLSKDPSGRANAAIEASLSAVQENINNAPQ